MKTLILTFILFTPNLHAAVDSADEAKAQYIVRVADGIEKKFDSKIVDIQKSGNVNVIRTQNGIVCRFVDLQEQIKCIDSQNKFLELDLTKSGLVEKAGF